MAPVLFIMWALDLYRITEIKIILQYISICKFEVLGDKSMGASWILKNDKGKVLKHSRRAFVEVNSVGQAKLQLWMWVLESMKSLKKKKVRLVSSCRDMIEAIEKPALWPAIQFETGEIKRELKAFEAWELRTGSWSTIRCASFIAQSVRKFGFTQSYVVAGHPRWLDRFYGNDRDASGH